SINYSIVGSEPLDEDALYDLNRYYDRNWETGRNYITEAKEVTVRLNYGSGDFTESITVVKIGGRWYLSLQDFNIFREIL
ncbi:MAG: hypothetical protein IJJ86_05610, partial [Clostridia bacterium]|nr:hypothetical protein [Clostridia bacterium]